MAVGTIKVCPAESYEKKERKPFSFRKPEKKPKKKPEAKPSNVSHIENATSDIKTERIAEDVKYDNKEPALVFKHNEGMDNISIAVVAENEVMAKDFVCGMYSNLLDFSRGSSLSVYVREHRTLTMLTETKQYLEEVISNPKDSKIRCSEEMSVVDSYVIVMGEAANQKLSLNVYINCMSYQNIAGAAQADAIFVILNKSDAAVTKETVERLSGSVPGRAISWVVTGLERKNIYYSSDLNLPPSSRLFEQLTEYFGIPCSNGNSIYFAQQYGGIVVEETEGSVPVYSTISNCREYTPVACCLPLVYSVLDIFQAREEKGIVIDTVSKMIRLIIGGTRNISDSWRKKYTDPEE